jgi:hypothetical protein
MRAWIAANIVLPRSSWLRRAGASRVLNSLGVSTREISLPHPARPRDWLKVALVECVRCHQVVNRTSPIQRHCQACGKAINRKLSRHAMARRRAVNAEERSLPD